MGKTNKKRRPVAESLPNATLSEQIQRALEMMQRIRTANAEQADSALKRSGGNSYLLPEPLVLRVSGASPA
jgi:hypothetical protein